MAGKKEGPKVKRGSWLCSKGHSTGGRASFCKVCGEPKPIKPKPTKRKQNADVLFASIKEVGGLATLKQLVADARELDEKLAPFGGLVGAERAIADFAAMKTAMEELAR